MKDYQQLWNTLKQEKQAELRRLEEQHKINHPTYHQVKQSIREMEMMESTVV